MGSRKQRHTISKGLQVSDAENLGKTQTGSLNNGGAKWRLGGLNAAVVAAKWRLSTRSIVILAQLQVYHTERPPICFQHVHHDAAHHVGLCQRQLILVSNNDNNMT